MPKAWETEALRVMAPEKQKLLSRVGNQPMSRNPTHQQTMLTRFSLFPSKAEVTVYKRLQTRLGTRIWVPRSKRFKGTNNGKIKTISLLLQNIYWEITITVTINNNIWPINYMYTVHCIIVCCLPTIRILHEPETAFTLLIWNLTKHYFSEKVVWHIFQ